MTKSAATLVPQFDRILGKIEAGDVRCGIAHLAGLLDAAMIACEKPQAIRSALIGHPLGQALRQPGLAAETARLDLSRSLFARSDLARRTCEGAQARGQRWIDLDSGQWPQRGARYGLILAVELPDRLGTTALTDTILSLSRHLEGEGRIVLSAFMPGHLGWGWQAIWLGRSIEHHEPGAIAEAANAAGLTPRQFHDADESLVWAELSQGQFARGECDA